MNMIFEKYMKENEPVNPSTTIDKEMSQSQTMMYDKKGNKEDHNMKDIVQFHEKHYGVGIEKRIEHVAAQTAAWKKKPWK